MLKDNKVDYSMILKPEYPIYPFTLYTPTFSIDVNDKDGHLHIQNELHFYYQTNQVWNVVPVEMSDMNREQINKFFKSHVQDNGLIVEIGVWRHAGDTTTSTQFYFENKKESCHYLGIDIEERPHILNRGSNIHFLQTDSANIDLIKKTINEKCEGKEIDFLFIDGLHTVEQVKKELALVNLVRKGGVIGFHDISVHAGPNMWMEAFSPDHFDIYKFRADNDWGVGFIVKKF